MSATTSALEVVPFGVVTVVVSSHVGAPEGTRFWKKDLPGGTVGKALEQGGTATGGVEQRLGHQEVIGDKVELGRTEFGKVDLVGARDMYLPARDLYQTLLVA